MAITNADTAANQATLEDYQNKSLQSAQDLQNQYNQQSQQRVGEYNNALTGANTAQSQLQDFTKNMTSGTDMYARQLAAANANAGYDVNNLNQAQAQVSQLTGMMGGLPHAIQANNANYGATAGNVANQYATTAANLNQSLGLANTYTAQQLAKQAAGLTGAQQSTALGMQGQDIQRQSYAAAATNATQVMQNSQKAMNDIETLAQQQGAVTASMQQAYATSKAQYAQAESSYAAASLAYANAEKVRYENTAQKSADEDKIAAEKDAAPVSSPSVTPNAEVNNTPGLTIEDKLRAFQTAPLQTKIGSLLPLSAEYTWDQGGHLLNNIGNWFQGN